MTRMTWLRAAPALAVLVGVSSALAADHLDGPGVKSDPTTDITDLYTWMDGNNVVFVLDVAPLAVATTKFSSFAQYVIHTTSTDKLLGGATPVATDIIATFDANQKISLWVGKNGYVTGDAGGATGIKSADGKIQVFAGLRDDPFFFNLDGFQAAVDAVRAITDPTSDAGLASDPAGCPALTVKQVQDLGTTLSTDPTSSPPGDPAKDYFAGKNVLAIVVSVDKSLVTPGGALVSAWASTNKGM